MKQRTNPDWVEFVPVCIVFVMIVVYWARGGFALDDPKPEPVKQEPAKELRIKKVIRWLFTEE